MLNERQIQRYARQLLLRDVGERGQEALGAVRVRIALGGEAANAAAAYLTAGGTEVELARPPSGPWARNPPLLGAPPVRPLDVVAAPASPEGEGIVVGSRAGGHVLWSAGGGGCPACVRSAAAALSPPGTGSGVQVGTAIALLAQRRALGVAAPLEAMEVSATGALSTVGPPACGHCPPAVPPEELAALVRHLRTALPDEGCAVLLGGGDRVRLVPMENAQAAHHHRDPEAFPRTARTAFSLDPRAWLALLREADAAGERPVAIAHSHPEGDPGLSAEDRRWAAPDGQPLFPGVAHLVVAFGQGRPATARWALWTDGDFLERPCPLPEET